MKFFLTITESVTSQNFGLSSWIILYIIIIIIINNIIITYFLIDDEKEYDGHIYYLLTQNKQLQHSDYLYKLEKNIRAYSNWMGCNLT
jgi:uncharacterized protein YxeA